MGAIDNIEEYFNTATIHGLGYFSKTKGFVRLGWIFVVITGFMAAGVLIQESFKSWSMSPVSISMETLPISELRFPKVTVCPPKNTYTNLNTDLINAEKIGDLDNETRHDLLDFVFQTIHDGFFEKLEHNSTFLKEENQYFNWYNGYSTIQFTVPGSKLFQLGGVISTTSLNGSFSTYGFDEAFNESMIFTGFDLVVSVLPINGYKDKNFTMVIEVFRKQMKNLSPGNRDRITFDNDEIPSEEDFKNKSIFLAPYRQKNPIYLEVERKVSLEDFKNQKIQTSPGMKMNWYIDRNDVLPWRKYQGSYKTKIFVRLVNILHENEIGLEEFWQIIKGLKKKFIETYDKNRNYCERMRRSHLTEIDMNSLMKIVEEHFGLNSSQEIYPNVTETTLNEAGKMYLYLFLCPLNIMDSMYAFKSIVKNSELKTSLLSLHRILKYSEDTELKFLAETILNKIQTILPFKWHQLELWAKGNVMENTLRPSSIEGQTTNHPVHILTEEGTVSPSAFIPFCELAGNMSIVGVMLDMFDVPVCNSFKAKILNDQLCYEIDVNQYIDEKNVKMVNKIGLTMILDYNEERQISNYASNSGEETIKSWTEIPNNEILARFYIDTNGK